MLFESKKPSHLTALFNAVVLKRISLRILIVINTEIANWDQGKSPGNREIRIIEVRLYNATSVFVGAPVEFTPDGVVCK